MRRRLLELFFACSLLLTLALAASWMRCQWVVDTFSIQRSWVIENDTIVIEYLGVVAGNGSFHAAWGRAESIAHMHVAPTPRDAARWTFAHDSHPATPSVTDVTLPWWQRFGIHWDVDRSTARGAVSLPAWLAVGPPLVATCTVLRRLLRARRRRDRLARGLCVTCGYDLSGAAHERCPECGGTVAAQAI